MQAPSLHHYVRAYCTLYERFEQEQQNSTLHRGHPFEYDMKALIFFFTMLQIRRIQGLSKASGFLQNCATWIRKPLGAKAPVAAGSMHTAQIDGAL